MKFDLFIGKIRNHHLSLFRRRFRVISGAHLRICRRAPRPHLEAELFRYFWTLEQLPFFLVIVGARLLVSYLLILITCFSEAVFER